MNVGYGEAKAAADFRGLDASRPVSSAAIAEYAESADKS